MINKNNIKVGVPGKVLAGDDIGSWVRIDDDSENTGGFLIHVSPNPDYTGGSEDWVENYEDLVGYFEESGWEIIWSIASDPTNP